MPRRSRQHNPESLRRELVELFKNFKQKLAGPNLRAKVQALIPAYHLLRDMGSSLIPATSAKSARERILHYLKTYVRTVIPGEELMVVGGIGEWARRVRELRVQFGWRIATGVTLAEMAAQHEFDELEGLPQLKTDDYMLLAPELDRDAAHRWNTAHEIRRQPNVSVQDRILMFLRANVGRAVTGEELRYVARDRSEWARRVRELRTEEGWSVATKHTGRPDLHVGEYLLETDRRLPPHDRIIPDPVRRAVLQRDGLTCQNCGWNRSRWDPADPRNLELHHRVHHARGGDNTADNLQTLCNVCHDEIHRKS